MSAKRMILCVALLAVAAGATALANYGQRQYYSQWSYHPTHSYNYTTYYYKPTPTYQSYNYHYCIHYPTQPRYVYYYNPHKQHYWGRLDCEGEEGQQYSLLKEEDRKKKLTDIPEEAFPKPAEMPGVPESEDGEKIVVPETLPSKDLPPADAATP